MKTQTKERVQHFRSIQAQYGTNIVALDILEEAEAIELISVMQTLGLPTGYNYYKYQLLDYLTYNNDLDQVATEFIARLETEDYHNMINKIIENI